MIPTSKEAPTAKKRKGKLVDFIDVLGEAWIAVMVWADGSETVAMLGRHIDYLDLEKQVPYYKTILGPRP
jgi:hypothetical protein